MKTNYHEDYKRAFEEVLNSKQLPLNRKFSWKFELKRLYMQIFAIPDYNLPGGRNRWFKQIYSPWYKRIPKAFLTFFKRITRRQRNLPSIGELVVPEYCLPPGNTKCFKYIYGTEDDFDK